MFKFSGIVLLAASLCSVFSESTENRERIVNGYIIDISQVPHQVLVSTSQDDCGGVLLSQDYVLTAAHCCDGNSYTIRAGNNNKNLGTLRSVSQVQIHPSFNPTTYENDVCVLKLTQSLPLSSTIKPATLASAFPQQAQDALISGWGFTTTSLAPTDLLHAGRVHVEPDNVVVKLISTVVSLLGSLFGQTTKPSTLFYTSNNNIGICYGDSGSGLVDQSGDVFAIATGILDANCQVDKNYFTDLNAATVKTFIISATGLSTLY